MDILKMNQKLYYKHYISKESLEPKLSPDLDLDKLNNHRYRCDDFTNLHNGTHVLFAGCSFTIGVGLFKEETWAWEIYNKMKNVSGYYNIGSGGASYTEIIFDCFKYINNFGKPKYIFILFPDLIRQDRHVGTEKARQQKSVVREYYMLESYCKENGIELISASWTALPPDSFKFLDKGWDEQIEFLNIFDTYLKFNFQDFCNDVVKFTDNSERSIIAADNDHPGTAFHKAWAKQIYDEYIKRAK